LCSVYHVSSPLPLLPLLPPLPLLRVLTCSHNTCSHLFSRVDMPFPIHASASALKQNSTVHAASPVATHLAARTHSQSKAGVKTRSWMQFVHGHVLGLCLGVGCTPQSL